MNKTCLIIEGLTVLIEAKTAKTDICIAGSVFSAKDIVLDRIIDCREVSSLICSARLAKQSKIKCKWFPINVKNFS